MLFCVKGKIFFLFSCKLFFHRCISPSFSACLDGREGWGEVRGAVLFVVNYSATVSRLSYTDLACHNSDYKKSKKL